MDLYIGIPQTIWFMIQIIGSIYVLYTRVFTTKSEIIIFLVANIIGVFTEALILYWGGFFGV